jgi:hypothetical protein
VTALRFEGVGNQKVRTELVANDSSFQASRVEAFTFLEGMEDRLRKETTRIDEKIKTFNNNMLKVIGD